MTYLTNIKAPSFTSDKGEGKTTQYTVGKITNNGIDLTLPTTKGTLARLEDIPASSKIYPLTITVDGSVYTYDGSRSVSITIDTSSGRASGGAVRNEVY